MLRASRAPRIRVRRRPVRVVVVADALPRVALRAALAVEKLPVQDREEPAAQRRVVAAARPTRQRALERRLDEIVGCVDVARQPERKRRSLGMSSRSVVVEGGGGHARPVAERIEMPRRTPVGAAYSTSIRKTFRGIKRRGWRPTRFDNDLTVGSLYMERSSSSSSPQRGRARVVALGRDRRRGGRRGRGVRVCRRLACAGASDPAPDRRYVADGRRRHSPGFPAQSREGRVRDRLLRGQRRRERVFGRAVLQGGAHAGGRAVRVAGRESVCTRQQRADPQPRAEAHRARWRAMANRDERDAGVSGRDAAGVLRAIAGDASRSEDGQARSGEGEGVFRRTRRRPRSANG